ncbi:hypothetical protein NUW58_g3923 [Xylaria curta]|uniref:Uncharacterized protein n=1 Tax=Xylaria curta TaxID=42375 RepID=A0ACC1PB07_9PEZI|nr:hypothetical protein NUW58_g3923 [Xylaria curta]
MKSVRKFESKFKKNSSSKKSSKTKTKTKTKTKNATKTSEDGSGPTIDLNFGENGEVPSAEEIEEMIKKMAQEQKSKDETRTKHDELIIRTLSVRGLMPRVSCCARVSPNGDVLFVAGLSHAARRKGPTFEATAAQDHGPQLVADASLVAYGVQLAEQVPDSPGTA